MEIKTTGHAPTHHLSVQIQNTDNTECGQENYHSLMMTLQKGTATLEESLVVSYTIKHAITTQSAIPLLCIYPNKLKIYVHIKTCTCIRAILLIAQIWKQLKCPSVVKKLWCSQTIEYYSVIKNKLSSHEKT